MLIFSKSDQNGLAYNTAVTLTIAYVTSFRKLTSPCTLFEHNLGCYARKCLDVQMVSAFHRLDVSRKWGLYSNPHLSFVNVFVHVVTQRATV